MKLVIISTCRNSSANFEMLCSSIDEQTDDRWQHIVIDDASDEDKRLSSEIQKTEKREIILNNTRKWALRNIVETVRKYQDDDVIIATVDGDDQLCNKDAVRLILEQYEQNKTCDVVWTAHKWDIREDINVSGQLPQKLDPYELPWRSSHLRTFRASLFRSISDENFKDHKGEWFRRAYDQALMLPVLKVGKERKYIDKVCYLYRIDSCTIPIAQRPGSEIEQIQNVAFIRARGFIK